jgi:hypothetical protein
MLRPLFFGKGPPVIIWIEVGMGPKVDLDVMAEETISTHGRNLNSLSTCLGRNLHGV